MAKASLFYQVPTDEPVVFITIDDGYFTDPLADAFVQSTPIPVTQFLTYYAASSGAYPPPSSGDGLAHVEALRLYQTGTADQRRVGCHQKEHLDYRGQSVADQQKAMTDAADWLGGPDMFNGRPRLFRPPYGQYDTNTLEAAYNASMPKLVLWTWAFERSSLQLANEYGSPRLRAGDIVLLHHPNAAGLDGYLMQQFQDTLAMIQGENLYPAYLHDYL